MRIATAQKQCPHMYIAASQRPCLHACAVQELCFRVRTASADEAGLQVLAAAQGMYLQVPSSSSVAVVVFMTVFLLNACRRVEEVLRKVQVRLLCE